MTMLILGVLLWVLVHLFPSLMPGVRSHLIERLGEGPYKGLFALGLVIAIVLMVFGWRSAVPELWYAPPLAGAPVVTFALVLIAFVLMGAGNAPTNIKCYLRHPMLTGVIVWGVAHLLANGDSRSIIVFGGLSIWAAIAIVAINRREAPWEKPDRVPVSKDVVLVVIGAVLTAVVGFFHEYLSGITLFAF
jgi:uncharacterized membrane protein